MNHKTITIIGSGNVATHLANAFFRAGHNILQIWSREFDHAESLANQVLAEPIDRLSLLRPNADIFILSVRDDALFDLALDLRFRDALVLHTSGSVGIGVLRPISRNHGVIWSPQTFVRNIEMDYSELPFCIQGSNDNSEREICHLLQTVSQHVFVLDEQQRQWLHLTSVMVNNFGNAINAIAQDLLKTKDIPFEILHPLISMTANKIKQSDNLWRLQTGPAIRRDQKTIDAHRKMLANQPALLSLYELMTQIIDSSTH